MKRTQIQLDEQTYKQLKEIAFRDNRSMSDVARRLLHRALGRPIGRGRRLTLADFKFVGAGRSNQGHLSPVSERHDEALAEMKPRRSSK